MAVGTCTQDSFFEFMTALAGIRIIAMFGYSDRRHLGCLGNSNNFAVASVASWLKWVGHERLNTAAHQSKYTVASTPPSVSQRSCMRDVLAGHPLALVPHTAPET